MLKKFSKYYDEKVLPIINASVKITIDDVTLNRITEHATKRSEYKKREFDHMIDNGKEVERTVTGLMGEAAVEKLLGLRIIDWTIGDSRRYNIPDICGYNVGIKTVEVGKFPIIYKKNKYPQVICVRDTANPKDVYIVGLASTEVLNKYQSEDLILSRNLRAKGYKTGFYGFGHLKKVTSLVDLKE